MQVKMSETKRVQDQYKSTRPRLYPLHNLWKKLNDKHITNADLLIILFLIPSHSHAYRYLEE